MDPAEILAWLNGRLVKPLVITHKGKDHTIWTLKDAQLAGRTVEDAVLFFCEEHDIDMAEG